MVRRAHHERSMIVISNTEPIALSVVEGRAQSPQGRSTGVLECWSDGSRPNTPLLQHSASFARLASEIFSSSLQTVYLQQPANAGRPTKVLAWASCRSAGSVNALKGTPSVLAGGVRPKSFITVGATSTRRPRPCKPCGRPAPAASKKPSGECVPGRGSALSPSMLAKRGDARLLKGACVVPRHDQVRQLFLSFSGKHLVAQPDASHCRSSLGRVC